MEDLVRVLDENPTWLEALRARLLTRELLDLPQQIAALASEVREFKAQVEAFVSETREFRTKVEAFVASTDRRFDAVDRRFDAVDKRFDAVDKRFDAVDRRFDAVDKRFDAVDGRIGRLQSDLGPIKAAHARAAALREADLIAEHNGLTFVRTLTDADVKAVMQAGDTAGIANSELRSFRFADLIVEARDGSGESCYMAVEISFTANGRDTNRAIRNAEFLKRFTSRPAYAVVAGLRHDDRIRDRLETGAIAWYQLDPQALEVE